MTGTSPRVFWSVDPDENPETEPWGKIQLCKSIQDIKGSKTFAICIIENITKEWVDYMKHKEKGLDLEPEFFTSHFKRRWQTGQTHHWLWAGASVQKTPDQEPEELRVWHSIEGAYLLHDEEVWTRISYYRVHQYAYLFLVNGPPAFRTSKDQRAQDNGQHGRGRVYLRFRYSKSSTGLVLPPRFDKETHTYDLFIALKKAMNQPWIKSYLFATPVNDGKHAAIRAHPLLYVLACELWPTNMQYLDRKIKGTSFGHIQNPQSDTDTKLHNFREDLDFLKTEIKKTLRFVPEGLEDYFASDEAWRTIDGESMRPKDTPLRLLEQTAEDAVALEEFLTNSLNFLLASIAVQDSQRAEMLTWLAAIYVPLSFVTSIFGMNLRELNDSTLPIWVCFEVLGVVLVLTIAVVWFYKRLRPWWKSNRSL